MRTSQLLVLLLVLSLPATAVVAENDPATIGDQIEALEAEHPANPDAEDDGNSAEDGYLAEHEVPWDGEWNTLNPQPALGSARGITLLCEGYFATNGGSDLDVWRPWGGSLWLMFFSTQRLRTRGEGNDGADVRVEYASTDIGLGLDTFGARDPVSDKAVRPRLTLGSSQGFVFSGIEFGALLWDDRDQGAGYVGLVAGPSIYRSGGFGFETQLRFGVFGVGAGGVLAEWHQAVGFTPLPYLSLKAGFDWATYHLNADGPDYREVIFRVFVALTIRFFITTQQY